MTLVLKVKDSLGILHMFQCAKGHRLRGFLKVTIVTWRHGSEVCECLMHILAYALP